MISRRTFLALLGAALGSPAAAPAFAAAPARRPNIIFFLVDDMGWQDTSLPFLYRNGKPVRTRLNRRYRTPNMEAMARDGMLFTDAYACSVCSPTRCSLLSGMNAARHRVTDWTENVDDQSRFLPAEKNFLYPPRWAVNGLQPAGTAATGTCRVPWEFDRASGTFTPGEKRVHYTMQAPFTNVLALPQILHDAGYATVHCGKAHWGSGSYNWQSGSGSSTPGADPRTFGFDINIAGYEVGGPSTYRNDRKFGNADGFAQGDIPNLEEYYGKTFADLTYKNPAVDGTKPVFLTDALTDKALKTLDRTLARQDGHPFCLYMSHYAIHAPLLNKTTWDAARSAHEDPAKDTLCPNPKDGLDWDEKERNFANLVRGMDDSLGTIRAWLKAKGLEENTLLVFLADNGGWTLPGRRMRNANAPLREGKGSCYEGGTRECCMAVWPGNIPAGTVSHEPIIAEDFYPTLLAAAGIPLPAPDTLPETPAGTFAPDEGPRRQVIDGDNLLPLLRGERTAVRTDGRARPLLWHVPNCWTPVSQWGLDSAYNFYTAVREGRWKLIWQHGQPKEKAFELYDLERDIGESANLAALRPDVTFRLRRVMGNLLRERGALLPHRGTADGPRVPYPDDPSLDPDRHGITVIGK